MSDVILALDTSSGTRTALVRDGRVLATRTQLDARAHAEHATPLVAEVLTEAGIAVGDLTGIVVGTGPAPFTGLRVGLATAQLLALAVDLPVWGVPSLDAWAAGAFAADPGLEEVLVATDARRREVYEARYVRDPGAPGGLRRVGDFAVHRPDPVAGPVPAVGTGTTLYPEAYPVVVAAVDLDPGRLADIGLARARAGEPVPLTPLYLRRPDVHGVPGGREPLAPTTPTPAAEER
ncbi:tRNA (adenosine(37)-N6)-threonylcarbamoyltransferase complex dimerization subunit type 1 TsaB [Serinibacter arcticus]|uniref:TsaB protein, required for threonylcarbamoyladenosine (T(6)A) formation in tRNA n=1 Tax=Serinibacter arcticus TaxID=1655435 RepID=A0A4Z1E9V4_9MICO|nr:tRNA (adenosine(37)-N6)-threonylcarbamoyltransferase complex dimerization subunit type 1 TsaB [Serinibacter arcticus]TGO06297.1 TsaB protein, required for threonylcarbamoyladenosine (t(6)A) formation in tRNA [Serinibacter arcticus]